MERDEQRAEETAAGMDDDLREMERAGEELADDVEAVRSDWQRKQADRSIPGAEPADGAPADGTAGEAGP